MTSGSCFGHPRQISASLDNDFRKTCNDDDQHGQRREIFPADHPVNTGAGARHQFDVVSKSDAWQKGVSSDCKIEWSADLPIETVEIGDGDTLEECDNEQRHISAEIVEQREYVIAGAVGEDDGEDATESAQGGCREINN